MNRKRTHHHHGSASGAAGEDGPVLSSHPRLGEQISRRAYLRGVIGAAAGLLFGGLATGCRSDEAGLPPVKIGYIPILDSTALLIAHAKGFYAEEGLTVERPTLIRGWSQLGEAFIRGALT